MTVALLHRTLAVFLICVGLAGCHTTRLGQSIDFPAPQQQQPRQAQ